MDPKSSVVKSKSSNSAITTKSDKSNKNKKSRSNAEFQPAALKRRGVYVEKKTIKTNFNSPDNKRQLTQGPVMSNRPPPRPRRGQKKFLANVLTILSKNTASTQYPDGPTDPDSPRTLDTLIKAKRYKRLDIETIDEGTQDVLAKKKPKYRSRVLNNMLRADTKKVVILKNKREISYTPSNYSDRSYKEISDARYKSLPPLVNYDDNGDEDDNANTMKNLVARSKAATAARLKKDAIKKLSDPITLVSENTKKDEKGLYNFFVDLLETTFSVYNVKADYNAALTPSEIGSKVTFEIDESVAKKLDVRNNKNEDKTIEEIPEACGQWCCAPKQYYCLNDQILLDRPKSPPISSKADNNKRRYKKKLKSESFFYQNAKYKTDSPPQSVVMKQRSFHKKNKKQTFINMFKEQLRMEDSTFEEPQNLHQALQIIARNKRRSKKYIHFADDVTKTDEPECVFKRRKVISSSTKSTKKNKKINKAEEGYVKSREFRTDAMTREFSDTTIYLKKLPKSVFSTDDDVKTDSYHSVEVQGYDFEVSPDRRMVESMNKKIVFAHRSSSEFLHEDFTPNTSILKFTDFSSAEDICSSRFGLPIKTLMKNF